MSNPELAKYWLNSAKEDWNTALALLKTKRYMHALFFCHLTVEKNLKGKIASQNMPTPISHDLLLLSDKANLKLNQSQAKLLSEVNSFNIRTRYDDYKNSFYKKATEAYAKSYIEKVGKLILWLQEK